jgi:hypothetical protein
MIDAEVLWRLSLGTLAWCAADTCQTFFFHVFFGLPWR